MRRLRSAAALVPAVLLVAAAAFASEGGGHEAMPLDKILWEMGIKVLDVAIIAFFAFKYLSKPITQAMAARSDAVRAAVEEATAGRRAAEARLAEFQAKAAGLEAEIEAMRVQASADMERERALLIEEGRTASERIAQHARDTIRQEVAKARAELHREAAQLAVQAATASVKAQITAADHQRILDEYAASLEGGR
ncbi:MAG TPA: ATP synthase F0 subunit B [bacterium]